MKNNYLSFHHIMTILKLLDYLISITSEVTSGSCTVLFPCLQAHPTEVILALQTGNITMHPENIRHNTWSLLMQHYSQHKQLDLQSSCMYSNKTTNRAVTQYPDTTEATHLQNLANQTI